MCLYKFLVIPTTTILLLLLVVCLEHNLHIIFIFITISSNRRYLYMFHTQTNFPKIRQKAASLIFGISKIGSLNFCA